VTLATISPWQDRTHTRSELFEEQEKVFQRRDFDQTRRHSGLAPAQQPGCHQLHECFGQLKGHHFVQFLDDPDNHYPPVEAHLEYNLPHQACALRNLLPLLPDLVRLHRAGVGKA